MALVQLRLTESKSCIAWLIILLTFVGCAKSTSAQSKLKPTWTEDAELAISHKRYDEAKKLADLAVKEQPDDARNWYHHGRIYFRLGQIDESIRDFDRVIQMQGSIKPYLWERGIALYYGKRYQDGADQFQSHREVNADDVENSVWHFLCRAKTDGLDVARKGLFPGDDDRRPPMKDVLRMFAGELTPDEVVKIADNFEGNDLEKRSAKFMGYAYVALYYHALDKPEDSRRWMEAAVKQDVGGYMLDVARIHLQQFKQDKSSK
jgi:tetratricopeptide (TPR) repeat protein